MSERIKKIRERLNRREKKIRADRQAKSRRIEKEEPKGVSEKATVKTRKAKKEAAASADEARGLASDAKQLVATELGVSTSEAESIIEQGASLFDDFGDQLSSMDSDGDGDTDLLGALDVAASGSNASGGGSGSTNDPPQAEAVGGEELFDPMSDSGASEPLYDPLNDQS